MIGGIKEFHIDIGRLISARLIKRRINSLLFSDNTHVYRVAFLRQRIVCSGSASYRRNPLFSHFLQIILLPFLAAINLAIPGESVFTMFPYAFFGSGTYTSAQLRDSNIV